MRRSTLLLSLTVVSGLLSVALFLPSRSEAKHYPKPTPTPTPVSSFCNNWSEWTDKSVGSCELNAVCGTGDGKTSVTQIRSCLDTCFGRCKAKTEEQTIERDCYVADYEICEGETPTTTPVPEAPSDPQVDNGYSGYRSSLNSDRVQCGNSTFDAVMDLKHEGYPAKDIKVRFTFNDQVKEISTNKDGRAKIDFDMAEGTVYAKAPDYPEQAMHISLPKDCPMPEQKIEQLANTGKQNELFVAGGMLIGLAGSIAAIYAYKKNQKVA